MRAKNREINIFNMSMLDVLTGALGAFTFLMLSFVPYYNIVMQANLTPSEQQKNEEKLQEDLEELKKENKELKEKVDELVKQLKMVGEGDVTAEELAKLQEEITQLKKEIERLKNEIDALEAENDELRAEIEKLKNEIAALEQEIDELRAEIEKLRARIKELEDQLAKRGDPQADEMLKRAQAEIFARDRSVHITGSLDSEEKFSFLVRDPKGFWHNSGSLYEFGEKSLRVATYSGWDAQEYDERDIRPRSNVMYLHMEGFLVPGTYLVGLRYAGEAHTVSEFTGKNKPTPSLGQELLKEFGEPPPGWSASSASAASAEPLSMLRSFPFSFANEAFAQTGSPPAFGMGSSSSQAAWISDSYPRKANRVFVEAVAEIRRRPMRPAVTKMPTQTLPVDPWVNIIAKVVTGEGALKFQWFDPLNEKGDLKDSIPGLAPGHERRQLESTINSEPIYPIKPRPECMGEEECARVSDSRGDITSEDIDPRFKDTIVLPPRIQDKERLKLVKDKIEKEKGAAEKEPPAEQNGVPPKGSPEEKAYWDALREKARQAALSAQRNRASSAASTNNTNSIK